MKRRWLAFVLSSAMVCSLLSPATVRADVNVGDTDLDIEEGVEDWEDEDFKCDVHSWGDWTVTLEPTCTESGSKTRTCKSCSETEMSTVPANGHTWNTTYTVDQEASCTTDGSKSIHCSVIGCLATQDTQVIPKSGHDFQNYKSNGDATCTADGTKTGQCTRCAVTDTMTDDGSKKAHSYAATLSKDDENHWHACVECGDKKDVETHNYVGDICTECGYERSHVHQLTFVSAVDETCTANGRKAYYTCSGCDSIFEDAEGKNAIKDKNLVLTGALGHSYDDEGICSRCGKKEPSISERKESEIAFANVKRTVDYTGDAIGLEATDVLVTAGDGTVSFSYYVNKECSVLTYAASDEADDSVVGSAPVEPGRYYVKAAISATVDYEEDTTDDVFVLTIRPRKVTSAKVVNQNSAIKLSWEKCEEADGYIIYRRKKGTDSSAYKSVKVIKDNAELTYVDSNIKQGNSYLYTIRAYKDAEDGTRVRSLMMSSALKITCVKVTSITNQNGSVKLKWTKVYGAAGYKVYRKSSSETTYRRIQTIQNDEKNYYVDKNSKAVKNGKGSYYYVKPYYAVETKEVLETAKKTNYYVSRNAVSSVSGTKKAFTVKWKKNDKASGYQICYSTSKNFSTSKKVNVAGKNVGSKKISGLKANKKYYVKIRTYKMYKGVKYYSAWSNVKNVKTK